MSKFVVLSDVHSNAPALKAVVDKEGLDREYIVLGDIMGLLAQPAETLSLVQSLDGYVIAGNHDKAIFHHGEGHVVSPALSEFELSHTILSLSHEQIDYMQELAFMDVVERDGQRICLTHANPWPEQAAGYEQGNAGVTKGSVTEIASIVSDDYDWVFHGHTHEQYDLDCAKFQHDVHFVNPGSLGYDETYTTVNTATGDVQHKSVEGDYDRDEMKAHVRDVMRDDMPHVDEWLD